MAPHDPGQPGTRLHPVTGDSASLPRIVLLPGMDGTGLLFRDLSAALGRTFEVSVVSYPPDTVVPYPDLMPHLADAVGSGGPCVVVAESFSGPLALLHASRRPSNLAGLVLSTTFARLPMPAVLRALVRGAAGCLPLTRPPRTMVRALLTGKACRAEIPGSVRAALGRVAPGVMASRLRQMTTVDVLESVSKVPVPLLYLAGSRDRLLGLRGWEQIRPRARAASCVTIEGPHLLLQVRTQDAAAAIEGFVRGLKA
jgi:pimeloyl-ACP methyl ester carboxylesterase